MEDSTAQARLLAVEVLLAQPELLGNDALEGDLYILRDNLKAAVQTQCDLPQVDQGPAQRPG
jgi:hypothetical protein